MTGRDTGRQPPTRRIPEWINPVAARGLVAVLAGLFVLTVPDFSRHLLALTVELTLITIGVLLAWGAVRRQPRKIADFAFGLLLILAGVVLAVRPEASRNFIGDVVGFSFMAFGLLIAFRSIRARATDENWVFHTVRGGLYLAFGIVLVFLPETIISGLVFAIAGIAIGIGALMLAIGLTDDEASTIGPGELGAFAKEWIEERDLGDDFRDDVVDSLYFEPPDAMRKQVGFWVLLVLSTTIATLGILADSTAVVIGAMLVAPLMTPIMGVSAGIVNGWVRRVSTSFATVAGGVVVSVSTAWIVTSWAPQLIPIANNSQVLSRISPTVIDMMIAVAAGAAGAYATIDKRVSSSITGVAIAVALVPPLGVVGVTLRAGAASDALGAFLLFATNLVSIILIAAIVFVIGGLSPLELMGANSAKMRTTIGTVVLGAVVIVVPLAFTSEGIIVSASRQNTAQSVVAEWADGFEDLRVDSVTVSGDKVRVKATGASAPADVADLDMLLEDAFGTPIVVTLDYFPSTQLTSTD